MRSERAPEDLRREALLEALKLLKRGESPAEVMERLSQRLTARLLHGPTKSLVWEKGSGPFSFNRR